MFLNLHLCFMISYDPRKELLSLLRNLVCFSSTIGPANVSNVFIHETTWYFRRRIASIRGRDLALKVYQSLSVLAQPPSTKQNVSAQPPKPIAVSLAGSDDHDNNNMLSPLLLLPGGLKSANLHTKSSNESAPLCLVRSIPATNRPQIAAHFRRRGQIERQ